MTRLTLAVIALLAMLGVWGCDVQQEEEGELPEVDVDADVDAGQLPEYEQTQEGELPSVDVDVDSEPGQLPEYDVQGPDVDIGEEEVTVPVPDVDVDMEERTMDVPTVDIDLPDDEEETLEEEIMEEQTR